MVQGLDGGDGGLSPLAGAIENATFRAACEDLGLTRVGMEAKAARELYGVVGFCAACTRWSEPGFRSRLPGKYRAFAF